MTDTIINGCFPKATRGVQLDACFAIMALWKEGNDYNYGIGYGVGSFMTVHRGRQNIRNDMKTYLLVVSWKRDIMKHIVILNFDISSV
ncbi:hypothetical protein [Halpernia sp. GG3]